MLADLFFAPSLGSFPIKASIWNGIAYRKTVPYSSSCGRQKGPSMMTRYARSYSLQKGPSLEDSVE